MSYITLPSSKVLDLCKKLRAKLDALIEGHKLAHAEVLQEELIRKNQAKRDSLWSFIFGYEDEPIPSIGFLKFKIENDMDHIQYDQYYEIIDNLEAAASLADEVHVSASDARLLTDF